MAATVIGRVDVGRLKWDLSRNDEGHREYSLTLRARAEYDDGPATVMQATGAPMIGSYWSFGSDVDPWAYCTPYLKVTPVYEDEKCRYWDMEFKFSTRPLTRCADTSIEDPLLEPPKISGGFTKYMKEAKVDRHGKMIKSSSHEAITGIEKDAARPSVVIEWNSAILDLASMSEIIDTLNDGPMWGLEARKIKLCQISWTRQVYGVCGFYYTKTFEFECRFDGFDEDKILDTGFKCLRGAWVKAGTATGWPDRWVQDPGADPNDPDDFIVVKDRNEENTPTRIPLDGSGGRLTDPNNPKYIPLVELYNETNFLAYGIPSVL